MRGFLKVSFWKNRAHSLSCPLPCNERRVSSISMFPPRKRGSFLLISPIKGNGKGWPLSLLCSMSLFTNACWEGLVDGALMCRIWQLSLPKPRSEPQQSLPLRAELGQLLQRGLQDTEPCWLSEIKQNKIWTDGEGLDFCPLSGRAASDSGFISLVSSRLWKEDFAWKELLWACWRCKQ